MATKVTPVKDFSDNDDDFLDFSENVATCLTNNTYFPNPPVTAAQLTQLNSAYSAAIDVAKKGGKGTVTARKQQRTLVETAHIQDEAYVTAMIAVAPPALAATMLASSGYHQKKASTRSKPPYAATRGAVAGDVVLNVKALGRHGTLQYCHQYSINNGQTWVDQPPTLETRLDVPGLPVNTVVLFRFRTLIKGVYGDWSQTISFPVH
jgi:hypothetical protein